MSNFVEDILATPVKISLKIGLYFGSYNPIHIGHLAIANYMVEYTDIDQLWFVVSPQNPFKKKSNLLDDYHRLELQIKFAKEHQCIIVLKGANTSIAFPNGRVSFNSSGNPGMATAGSGDVLTGVIAGLIGQGLNTRSAVIAGVYLHGLAGDIYAKEKGTEISLTAGDLLDNLPESLKRLVRINQTSCSRYQLISALQIAHVDDVYQ